MVPVRERKTVSLLRTGGSGWNAVLVIRGTGPKSEVTDKENTTM